LRDQAELKQMNESILRGDHMGSLFLLYLAEVRRRGDGGSYARPIRGIHHRRGMAASLPAQVTVL